MRIIDLAIWFSCAATLVAQDITPPTVSAVYPAPNSTVPALLSVEVIFNEDVQGVDPADLRLNGVAATNITFGVPGQFVFEFPPSPTGQVTVAFAAGHGITDLANNPFAGGSWNYTVNPAVSSPAFRITEFMASNDRTLNDEDGDQPDWIEIYNPGPLAADLAGWYLTDAVTNLTQWRFPSRLMDPNTYLVVFASGKNRTNAAGNLHTSFQLRASSGYLALVNPTTNIISAFSPTYPTQVTDISYGRDRVDPSILGYFTTPTPRAANSSSGAGFAPEVVFSRPSGTFSIAQPFQLTLSAPGVAGAQIFYSFGTNFPGSNTPNSFLYSGPITVTNTLAIRTRAFAPSRLPGPVKSGTYIGLANQTNVINFNSDLPIMILHNYGQGVVPANRDTELYVYFQTFETDCGRSSMTNPPTLSGRGVFHSRGSSTIADSNGKPSLFMEVRDEFNEDLEVPLLGLPDESDWVLYAPNNFEPALFHNPLAHALANDMGQYASRTRFFELYIQDSTTNASAISGAEYHGIYVLEEKIKRDNNRVDIAKLEPEHLAEPEITGGYMFSIDRIATGETQLGAGGTSLNWIEPGYTTMTNAARAPQVNYIRNYLNAFNNGLLSAGGGFTNVNSTNYYGNYIDVDSWVTRHIHEVTTFNVDALRLSGYFFKDRGKKIEYGPAWDYDRTQGSTDGRDFNPRTWRSRTQDLGTDFFNFSPWWGRLLQAPDFWQQWIDTYQKFRRPGNALDLENVIRQINRLANEVREAQPRNQARWGFAAPRTGSQTTDNFTYNFGTNGYQNEVNFKIAWYSNRLDFMDTNFLSPPTVTIGPGQVTPGTTVYLKPAPKPATFLIYTVDGTDPRLSGGGISPAAIVSSGPITLTISSNINLFARSWNTNHRNLTGANNPPASSPWSGPTEGAYYVSLPALRITELMYHPADPPQGSTNSQDDFEYIEFTNIGGTPINLAGYRLRGGVDFDFPSVVLGGNQSGVIVRDLNAFRARYGQTPLVIGVYTNDNLSNSGEELRLWGSRDEPILDFSYDDGWYPGTDGAGFSLVIVNASAPTTSWGLKASWRPSGTLNGSPGAVDPAGPATPAIVINEILTHTDPPQFDSIELFNPTASPVNIGGWYLTDDFDAPKKFRIPNGVTIPANGYLVFQATNQANPSLAFGSAFGLSSTGGEVYLFSGDPVSNQLTGYSQGFDFGPQANGVSFGRYLVSTGGDQYPVQSSLTLGGVNSGPLVGPVVISEIHYHPRDVRFLFRSVDNCIDEFIELRNISAGPVSLFDPAHATNRWRLRDAIDFTFPANTVLPAGGVALVVAIDPSHADQAADFRARNGVPGNIPLYGPFTGQLDNSSDSVELVRPDTPNPGEVPYILVERVRYEDQSPWPSAADGLGHSLQRISLSAYGNDPANWAAAAPTAGADYVPGAGPTITTEPGDLNLLAGQTALFTVAGGGPGPLRYQWHFKGSPIDGATNGTLVLPNVRASQAGAYQAVALNNFGAAFSRIATLGVVVPVSIVNQPASVRLRGSTNNADYGFTTNNATIGVGAASIFPISFQWRFNGQPILGATNSFVTITNVGLSDDGVYDVTVSDSAASFLSAPARLTVLLSPTIIQTPPANYLVASNGSISAGIVIRGNPPPFYFRWNELSSLRVGATNDLRTNYMVYGPITNYTPRTWRIIVTNEANVAPTAFFQFSVAAAVDTDGDGIPDDWETQYGFGPNNLADATVDSDHDGLNNLAEYNAGTNPTNSSSYLKVELSVSPGSANLLVGAVSNRTYTVQYTDNPENAGGWLNLASVLAQGTNRVESVVDTSWTSNRFYRVLTPAQTTPTP